VDEEEFEHLYSEHWREVLGYALRRTGSPSDAADVASEVFLVVWRRRDEVPGRDDFRPWLYGVARNVLLNHRRSGHRRERLGAMLLTAVEEQHPDTAQIVVDRDEHQGLIAAVRGLPEPDRELVTLVSWDGLSPTEAADALQMNPVTARVRLHRARKRLRASLEEQKRLEQRRCPENQQCPEDEIRRADRKREPRPGHVRVDGRAPVPAKEVT
jgi:RNA polymerase sigma-70 factor (ECF subfamily)